MKTLFTLHIVFFISLNLLSQAVKKSDLIGKWYQCEKSDGKVIVLNNEKCFNEVLNSKKTRLLSTEFNAIEWEFNRLGHYSVKNNYTDSLSKKGEFSFTKKRIELDGVAYYITKSDSYGSFTRNDYVIFTMTLVREDYFEMYALIDSQVNELRTLLNEDWIIVPIDSGFSVYYNKGQNVEFERHLNSVRLKDADTLTYNDSLNYKYFNKENNGVRVRLSSYFTENDISPDSISWFSSLGRYMSNPSNEELRKSYPKNGVLKIDVTFQPKWSKDEINKVQSRNNNLSAEMITKGLTHTNKSIFHDYRYWVPKNYWQRKSELYDYSFERLPYESSTNNYSIFINPNVKCFFCEPLYVDDSDSTYFSKKENNLEAERQRIIRIIALSLGIQDFDIVGSYSAFDIK